MQQLNSEFYISVIPLIVINGGFITGYILFLLFGFNKKVHGELKQKAGSKLIIASLQNYWFTDQY